MAKEKEKKSDIALREERILAFWRDNDIFEKSVERNRDGEDFVFYDGPPFATGLPHYGHVLPGTMKDIIPRYKTMQGYQVERRWGWDCHGLPLENQVEEHLGIADKQEIEEVGIDTFNETAKKFVLQYADDWRDIVPRTGRWVDMENDYRTMDPTYTESIWWAFKRLHEKDLLYEGFKSMHICPRCQTPLSNFEVNQGYTDVKDLSVTAKFKLVGEENTYILAWTTTPWTLPGNMALAVGADIEYRVVEVSTEEGDERYIVARDRLEDVMGERRYDVVDGMKGEELEGVEYEPVFSYYTDTQVQEKVLPKNAHAFKNAWKVYAGEFVTLEEGTGIVHIAPAFGSDDLALAQEFDIPVVHHVSMQGEFAPEVSDFAGMPVKKKGDYTSADIEIIKWLAHNERLFDKQKIEHSYPLCWRCDTPLLNYATSSWFIEVPKIKDKLIEENNKIHWVPESVGSNRFGEWLEGARDWAISRLRYWGAPLPAWKSESGEVEILGSLEELKEKTKSTNTYFMMRHGEAHSNVERTNNADASNTQNSLTPDGKDAVVRTAEDLKGKIDIIFHSPLLRTKETAHVVADTIGLAADMVVEDERLAEVNFGDFEGKKLSEYHDFLGSLEGHFSKKPEGGEDFNDVKQRMGDFIYDIDAKYEGKTILIVSHSGPLWMLDAAVHGHSVEETCKKRGNLDEFVALGEARPIEFARLPHNSDYVLDYHRPYIDEIVWINEKGEEMKRIPDVFDCWVESGSMPYASNHYPFEKEHFDPDKDKWFPADFIAEGLDQTRGWFYAMLVLGVGLFDRSPYENVIVNGLVLAEDGKKMSKRLKNYPEMDVVLNSFGADALRYFLVNSPAVRAESLNFSEKGLDEVVKKIIRRLENIYSFIEMYGSGAQAQSSQLRQGSDGQAKAKSSHVLDMWMLERLHELRDDVTKGLEAYELDKASRPFLEFVDDLSTWYVRRSRDRMRGDASEDSLQAESILRYVLKETCKLIAPFMPFLAEDLYQKLKNDDEPESVHLCAWPEYEGEVNHDLIALMQRVRYIVTLALDARAQAGVKVRQPLASLIINEAKFAFPRGDIGEQLSSLVADEVNVKEVLFKENMQENIELNLTISPELEREGHVRELIRAIQSMRKKANLDPSDEVVLVVRGDEYVQSLITEFSDDIKSIAGIKSFEYSADVEGEKVDLSDAKQAILKLRL